MADNRSFMTKLCEILSLYGALTRLRLTLDIYVLIIYLMFNVFSSSIY